MDSFTEGAERLVDVIESVAGNRSQGLHDPIFQGNEINYVVDCIKSGFVSSAGEYVGLFEKNLADFVGAPHCVAVVSGTAALNLALVAAGVQYNDEVIVPSLTFVATANAVVHAGAIPHFVDVEEETWGIDSVALRSHLEEIAVRRDGYLQNKLTGRRIFGVVPMHTLGHPVDIHSLIEVTAEFGIELVEDAAESLGSYVGDRHTGLFGKIGVFSFNGNKTITTGGGGALVTSDLEMAERVRHLSTQAKKPHRFEFDHDAIGFNYRMPNLNAALGVAQIEQLPDLLAGQKNLASSYQQAFSSVRQVLFKTESAGTTSNYWLQAILLDSGNSNLRNEVLVSSLNRKIPVRPLWKPLNKLPSYSGFPSARTPISWSLYERVICLPSSSTLGIDKLSLLA